MLRKKEGLPKEGELVICTVTKIYHSCVFVTIDEYNKSGMIHISEISPGRIRNIRDYVVEGKKVITKVLRIDQIKGNVDLSLRRVSEAQKREKADDLKQEQKAEKIIEFVASKTEQKMEELYNTILSKTENDYDSIYSVFEEFISDESTLKSLGLPDTVFKELADTIRQRIKPPEVKITGVLIIKSYAPNGVELVKTALVEADKTSEEVVLSYLGAGRYQVEVVDSNYKDAEKKLKVAVDKVTDMITDIGGEIEFNRVEA